MIAVQIEDRGVQELLSQIRTELGERTAAKILRRALRKACTEIRNRVRSHPASAPVMRAVSATLGYKVVVKKGVIATAKLGFGLRRRGGSRWRELHRLGLRSGVGLSERNIHWAVLGTSPRHTKKGYYRGRMPAYYSGFLAGFSGRVRELLYEQALMEIQAQIQKIAKKV